MAYEEWVGARSGSPVWRVSSAGGSQLVLPDAAMDLIWFDGKVVVAGPDTAAVAFDRSPGQATWGLRLAPGLAHALLGVSARELTDLRVPLEDIIGSHTIHGAFATDIGNDLEETLLRLCERAQPSRSQLSLTRAVDRAARAGLSARAAAASVSLAERTLHRNCLRWFGYGYTMLARIHRFQRAMQSVAAGASLSGAAAGAGYADQPHFTRECRRLSGMTPAALTAPG